MQSKELRFYLVTNHKDDIDFDTSKMTPQEATSRMLEKLKDSDGRKIYGALYDYLGGGREASLYLLEHGIKGITYDGRQDGRCYVIFDGADAEIKETLYQDGAKTYEAQLEEDSKEWQETLKAFETGSEQKHPAKEYDVMKTPLALVLAGAEHLDVVISREHLEKIYGKHGELLGQDGKGSDETSVLANLPRLLADPVMVVKDRKHPNTLDIMTEAVIDGNTVMASIKLSKKSGRYAVNEIATSFAREFGENGESGDSWYFGYLKELDNVKYVNTKKIEAWMTPRTTRADVTQLLQSFNEHSIPNETELVNLRNQKNNEFYQSNPQSGKRGSINLAKTVNAGEVTTINLTENADVSTVMHEMAHFALNYLKGINATPQLNTLGNWWTENATDVLKGTDCTEEELNSFIEELKTGKKNETLTEDKRQALSTATQEYFARGFEAYLREGKSPNAEMRNIFRRMREWLKAIYSKIRLRVTLNDDVRQLFDKLLVSDASIERAEAESGYGLSDDTIMTAKEIFFRRVIDELLSSDAEKIKNFREDRLPSLREEIKEQPIYQAVDKIASYEGINKDTIPAELKGKIPSEALAKAKDGGIDFELACAVAQDTAGYQTEDEFINDLVDYVTLDDAVNATLDAETANLFGNILENYDETTLRGEDVIHGLDEASDNIAASIVASDEELGVLLDEEEEGQGQTLYQNDADYGTDDDTGYQDEYNAIEEKYRDTDQWMKAPNGKPTNLTERQWVQVRTPSFKKWFGDWENSARIEKLRKSEPIAIKGTEIEASEDLAKYRENAFK